MDGTSLFRCEYSNQPTPIHKHSHMDYEILYVKKGEIGLSISSHLYTIHEGNLYSSAISKSIASRFSPPAMSGIMSSFSSLSLDRLINNPKLMSLFKNRPQNFCHVFPAVEEAGPIFTALLEESRVNDPLSAERAACLIKELLILLYRRHSHRFPIPDKPVQESIYQVQKYIDQNFAQDIKIKELAEKFYINFYYLSHTFKELTGYSPKQYLLLNRLTYSKELLAQTSLSVGEIAMRCGFSDANSFIRTFRRHYGTTPSQYRRP
ncbi:MAG: helix-turn-helix domain-containing protein [Clostridia bacterium]